MELQHLPTTLVAYWSSAALPCAFPIEVAPQLVASSHPQMYGAVQQALFTVFLLSDAKHQMQFQLL